MTKHLPLAQHLKSCSPIVFGCMGLGGDWDQSPITKNNIQDAHTAIDAALEFGINLFDHADIYTFGKAELVFGEVLKQRPELAQHIYIQSKCGIRFADENAPKRYDFSESWIKESTNNILKRLGVEQLDTLLLHRPDPLMNVEEVAYAFESLMAQGKVKHFGVSNMPAPQMAWLQSVLDQPLVCNQLEISLSKLDWLDQNVVANSFEAPASNFVPGTIEYCQQNKVQLQAWGCLSQGLFTGNSLESAPEHVKNTAKLVKQLAVDYQVPPEAIVLAFIMRHPAKIQPVIGTTNPQRIKACAMASDIELSREHWYQLYVSARGQELP